MINLNSNEQTKPGCYTSIILQSRDTSNVLTGTMSTAVCAFIMAAHVKFPGVFLFRQSTQESELEEGE
jgi:hypothetical protein